MLYLGFVVEGQVQPRTETNLQNAPQGEGNHFCPLSHVGLQVAGEVYNFREYEARV